MSERWEAGAGAAISPMEKRLEILTCDWPAFNVCLLHLLQTIERFEVKVPEGQLFVEGNALQVSFPVEYEE